MRKQLLSVWLLLPVGAGAYHMGPGQDRMQLDEAGHLIEAAEAHVERAGEITATDGELAATEEWALAEEAFEEALGKLPAERVRERRSVRLERAKCQMMISELPVASSDLQGLVDEMVADSDADPELLRDARRALANSQYYMTWLTRLEGAPREEWEPRIEAARQTFKLLAEELEEGDDEEGLVAVREDLESAIRLTRMDLTELQGLPLPSQ